MRHVFSILNVTKMNIVWTTNHLLQFSITDTIMKPLNGTKLNKYVCLTHSFSFLWKKKTNKWNNMRVWYYYYVRFYSFSLNQKRKIAFQIEIDMIFACGDSRNGWLSFTPDLKALIRIFHFCHQKKQPILMSLISENILLSLVASSSVEHEQLNWFTKW